MLLTLSPAIAVQTHRTGTIFPSYESILFKLPGFCLQMLSPDLLHVWNLGARKDVIASVLPSGTEGLQHF